MNKFIATITATVAILFVTGLAANAYAVDLTEKGSIIIVVEYDGKALPGIDVEICQVADAIKENGGIKFTLTDDFIGSSVTNADLTDLSAAKNAALSSRLNAYASNNNIQRESKTTNSNGIAQFSDLSAGLYLVSQKNPPAVIGSGNNRAVYTMQSFLVSVPYPNADGLSFSVTVHPKCEVETIPTSSSPPGSAPPGSSPPDDYETPPPVDTLAPPETRVSSGTPITPETMTTYPLPDESTPVGETDVPPEPTVELEETPPAGPGDPLPQTGILRWPVLLLSVSGIILFLLGVFILYKDKKINEK